MTDRPERDNLLPGDATPLERAIADTDGRLDDIDMDLARRIGGPDVAEVPAAYLAHRAWGRSVDVWDPLWPDDVKRAVIAAAPIVHTYKGTRFAVETALSALRVAADIVEWWETTPKGSPYTFEITAYAGAVLYEGAAILDARLVRAVETAIMHAKPLSRLFRLRVGVRAETALGLAPVQLARTALRLGAIADLPVPAMRTDLGLAPAAVARTQLRFTALVEA